MEPPSQHEVGNDAQADKNPRQSCDVDPVVAVVHREFLEEPFGIGEWAENFGALELFPAKAINRYHRTLKAVPHVADVGHC